MPKWLRRPLVVLSVFFLVFLTLHLCFPIKTDIEYSQIVVDEDGEVLHAFLTYDDKWRMYTELDEISPTLKKAIIHKEDKYFYWHLGINPIAIARAAFNNLVKGRRTSGASTISMQVARLLYPAKRTYGNKLIEMFRAMQLELKYSKSEILQLYLNLVPYGGNIEGVKSASVLYFQKSPDHLSLAEVTALSIIPNRPSSLQIGENNAYIKQERNKWLETFKQNKVFPLQDIEDALSEPLDAYRHESPKFAPHLSYRLKYQFPNTPIIKTSIKQNTQQKIEQIVKNYIQRLYYQGIKNAAVLILDNESKQVVSYVGSADFWNEEDGGQVDGIRAVRQPGSALKPLLYATAFDAGVVTPKTMITDVPINFGGYRPENYDERFHGYVSMEEALAYSLNIPAVKMLDEIGVSSLIDKLKLADFEQIEKDQDKLGLSLVLGGCGVTLEEMTALYASFANGGEYENICWIRGDTPVYRQQVVSPMAAFAITEIMTQLERPDLPMAWQNSVHTPKIAWKTGTSYGRRDAWSIGYNKKYTIGVWVGNFSGVGVPDLTGANTATPLLFEIFNSIDYNSPNEWYGMPEGMDFRLVCPETGLPPGDNCEHWVMDYYIPMISTNEVCQHMTEVWVSANDSMSYCTSCLPEAGYKTVLYHDHPNEMIAYFENYHIHYEQIPPHNPECERVFSEGPPKITSPSSQVEYLINENDEEDQLLLSCHAANDVQNVYWYVDNHYYGEMKRDGQLFLKPREGRVKISCTDDKGRNTDLWINVRYVDL